MKTINEQREEIIQVAKDAIKTETFIDDGFALQGAAEEVADTLIKRGYRKTFTSDFASDTQKAFKEDYEKAQDEIARQKKEIDIIALDCNDVDHIAEEVAENVYDLYTSVFDNEIENLKRGIKELQSRNADLKRVNEAIQRATAQDILQQMWDWKDRGTPFIADIQELADRYGVEVENDD